ncbi:MAG TPA: GntR family transcriptional regulator [Pseudonocardia sp.]
MTDADKPAAERAYALTKELLLTGELPGGHLFSEGDIANRLGVSRTPVREAFLRLQAEDLLRLVPKRGAIVVPVPPGEAEDVLDAREAIETAAVRRLLRDPARVPGTLETLRGVLASQHRHAEAGDLAAFAATDEAFHRTIVAAGGNNLTMRFYVTLADRQRRMSLHALRPAPEMVAEVLRQHLGLIDVIGSAVESGDPTGFTSALREHLDRTHRQ